MTKSGISRDEALDDLEVSGALTHAEVWQARHSRGAPVILAAAAADSEVTTATFIDGQIKITWGNGQEETWARVR